MTPPGLAFASVSTAALAGSERATAPRFYLDWERALQAQAGGRTPFTPAVSLIQGLDAAIDLLLADGIEHAWERSRRLGFACREGVKAMGLELFSPDEDRSAVVTAIRVPAGVDGEAIVRAMRERSGVTVAGGQGELRGKIVRIGHIGEIDLDDVTAALAALELGAADAGAVELGAASPRAREAHAAARPRADRALRRPASHPRSRADRRGGSRAPAHAVRRRRGFRRRPRREICDATTRSSCAARRA